MRYVVAIRIRPYRHRRCRHRRHRRHRHRHRHRRHRRRHRVHHAILLIVEMLLLDTNVLAMEHGL